MKGKVLYGGFSRSLNNQCHVGAVCGPNNYMSRSIIYNIKEDWCINRIAALLHPKRYYRDCDVIGQHFILFYCTLTYVCVPTNVPVLYEQTDIEYNVFNLFFIREMTWRRAPLCRRGCHLTYTRYFSIFHIYVYMDKSELGQNVAKMTLQVFSRMNR